VGLLALAAVAGLAAVERKGFLQAMLSRPVVLGPLAGLACGDPAAGLLVGAPLELLWLGAVNLGAALPLHESVGTAAIAGGAALAAQRAGIPAAAAAALAAAVGLPFSVAGRRADALVERANQRLADRAAQRLAAGDEPGAVRSNLIGLLSPFAISAVLAPLGAAAAGALAPALIRAAPGLVRPLELAFAALAAFSCAAGAKALRARRAPAAYLGAAAAGLALLVLAGRMAR
jgi:PTS system mannose-specific IIC component